MDELRAVSEDEAKKWSRPGDVSRCLYGFNMYIYIYIYMVVYMGICIYIYVYIHIYIYICIYNIYIYITYMDSHVNVYINIYKRNGKSTHTHICIYIYIYTYIHALLLKSPVIVQYPIIWWWVVTNQYQSYEWGNEHQWKQALLVWRSRDSIFLNSMLSQNWLVREYHMYF